MASSASACSAKVTNNETLAACLPPSDLEVPFTRAARRGSDFSDEQLQSLPALRWDTQDCIPVEATAGAAEFIPLIRSAVAAYTSLECDTLCFDDRLDEAATPAEEGERLQRILFTASSSADDFESADQSTNTNVAFSPSSGQILDATITVRQSPDVNVKERSLTVALAIALGLGKPDAPEIPSIRQPSEASGSSQQLTAFDAASLCGMYDQPNFCE